jgi:hypothetical protein
MGAQLSTTLDGETLPPNFSWLIQGRIAAMGLPQRREEMRGLVSVNVQLFVTLNNAALIAGHSDMHGPAVTATCMYGPACCFVVTPSALPQAR